MDTRKRTMAKTITWRIIAVLTTIIVVYFWTGDFSVAFGSGLIANALKMILYYTHERIWDRNNFGREVK